MGRHSTSNRRNYRPLALALAVVAIVCGLALVVCGTACDHEYSSSCVWYGPVQGNGSGTIVVNLP